MVLFSARAIPRTVVLAVLAVATAWASDALPPFFDGRMTPPRDVGGHGVRDLLSRADRAGAMEYAKPRRLLCDADLAAALREIQYQQALRWFQKDYTRAQGLMELAADQALKLLLDARARSEADAAQARTLVTQVEEQLEEARALARQASTDAYVRQRMATAEIRLRDARQLLARGRNSSALASARESLKAVETSRQKSRSLLSRFEDPQLVAKWQAWIREAVAESRRSGSAIVVIKERHRLDLYRNGSVVRSMAVDLGAYSLRQKMYAGDRTTPEGRYRITRKKSNGSSKYGQALLLNYPNDDDRRRFQEAKARREISARSGIGGLIEIHGQGGLGYDWTDGCIAPDDRDMGWLYNQAGVGTLVVIVGSDGSDGPIRATLKQARKTS